MSESKQQEFEKYQALAKIIEWFANNVPCPGSEWNKLLREINIALYVKNDIEQEDKSLLSDLEQLRKENEKLKHFRNAIIARTQLPGTAKDMIVDILTYAQKAINKTT